jgi:hypothetical protein
MLEKEEGWIALQVYASSPQARTRNCRRRNSRQPRCALRAPLGYSFDLISTAEIEFLSLMVKINVSD